MTSQTAPASQTQQIDQEDAFQLGGVVTIAAAHSIHDTYTAFLSPLLPTFIANLSLSNTQAGLLSSFMQAPSLLQPLIGHIADRTSLRYIVILAPALTTSLMSWLGVTPSYVMLALLLLLVGVSSAAFHAVGPVFAGKLSGDKLGRGMAFWMAGGELARTLGPLLIVTTIRLVGIQRTPWLMVLGWLMSLLLFLSLRKVSEPQAPHTQNALPWRSVLGTMGPVLIPLAGVILVRAMMVSAMTIFLPTFLTSEGSDLWLAGASLSVLQAAGIAGAFLGGSLSDRWGRRLILGLSMLTAPLLLFLFLPASSGLRFPLLLGMGFALLSTTPVLMALVQESFPDNRALANGVYMALSFLSSSGAALALGGLGDWVGLRPAFVISAVLMLIGAPLVLLLPKENGSAARAH